MIHTYNFDGPRSSRVNTYAIKRAAYPRLTNPQWTQYRYRIRRLYTPREEPVADSSQGTSTRNIIL